MTDVCEIIQQIVDDDVVGNWEGGTERGIGYELGDTSFDTWYYDAVRDFLDWYVQGYQANNNEYPPSWVLDVINYEKDNYGESGLIDIGNNYERFHRYVNYIKLMEFILEVEDSEVVSDFKLAMECVFDRIVSEEGEESEESEEESEEEEEEEVPRVSQVPRVAEVDSDSSDSDDSDYELDIVKRDTDHIVDDSDSDSDIDSD